MRKSLKRVLKFGGLALGSIVILLAVAALLVLFDKPLVKRVAQSYIAKKAGFPIQIGKLDYEFFPLRVMVSDVRTTYRSPIFTTDVAVSRIEAAGNLRKLLKGIKPAFEKVDVDIAELRFDQEKISPVPIDFRGILQQTSSILAYTRQASIACGRLTIALPGQSFAFDNLTLALSEAAAANVYDLRLASNKVTAGMNEGRLSLESPLRVDGSLTLAPSVAGNLRLALDASRITAAGRVHILKDLTLNIDGAWNASENRLQVDKLALAVPGLVALSGSGSAGLNKPLSLEASGDYRFESLESLAVVLGPSLPPDFRDVRLRGRSRLAGTYTLSLGSDAKAGRLEASLELDRFGLEYDKAGTPLKLGLSGTLRAAASAASVKNASKKPVPLTATLNFDSLTTEYAGPGLRLPLKLKLSGKIKAEGSAPDFRASADIRSALGAVSLKNLNIKNSSIRLLAEGGKDSANISRLDAALEGVSVSLPCNKNLSFDTVEANGAARANIARKSVVVSNLDVQLPTLSPLRLSGRFDAAPRGVKQAHLESRELKIPALRELLGPFLLPALDDWKADGSMNIVLDAKNRFRPGAGWEFSGDADISGMTFNDPTFTIASDSLSPHIRFQGDYELSTGGIKSTGTLELASGESLWKELYISWSKHPLKADLAGRYEPASGTIEGLSVNFAFPGLGEVSIAGDVRLTPSLSFDLTTGANVGLEPLYSLYSQSGVPPENRLHLAGEIAADLALRQDKSGTTVDGRVKVDASDIENHAANLSMRGLKAELPVHLQFGEAPPAAEDDDSSHGRDLALPGRGGPADKGILEILEIRMPSLTLQPPVLNVHAGTNAYQIENFTLDLFGGRLEFSEIALMIDPAAGGFHGTASLRLPELDLSSLPVATAQFPLTGIAKIDFPVLDITPAGITTKGEAGIDIFGGRVVVRNLAVSNPLAKGRKISGDVELRDLNLKKITDIVPFGEMTGIIKGEIRGLTISYGQPESFVLSLESVPRKGVSQTFSLKAVDNLTVLSSGQKASAGMGQFFMRFIRGFRYAKIGIVSTLKNDIFTLNGTIHDNGLEYLVKKPALFGINVINRMPDKKISFKEMMSRLERVGQSEAQPEKK
ncbi:MAG: hypothetical protein JXE07_01620 [Candidatus Aminicenantes bacterium]|nr:hypothetical protein [Candidatus Aminicenantes bacterium]